MWKEAIMTYFEVLCRYVAVETEGKYENISRYSGRNSSVAACANLLGVMCFVVILVRA
jgi:hypothetical protein